MAPEMALGDPVDARTDLYALGCVAYYLLTGSLVFEAENAFQMLAKRLRDEPVPPSKRSPLSVPAELDDLVLRCLAKDPKDRPASAAALGRSLGAITVASWGEEEASEWWKANRPA